jgi:sec-independent protein translocase protein TatA
MGILVSLQSMVDVIGDFGASIGKKKELRTMNLSAGFLTLPGGTEWFIILLVVIVIFGPKSLPKLGSAMGSFVKNLKAGQRAGEDVDEPDVEEKATEPRRKPSEKV